MFDTSCALLSNGVTPIVSLFAADVGSLDKTHMHSAAMIVQKM
jgi:hypothetical protein